MPVCGVAEARVGGEAEPPVKRESVRGVEAGEQLAGAIAQGDGIRRDLHPEVEEHGERLPARFIRRALAPEKLVAELPQLGHRDARRKLTGDRVEPLLPESPIEPDGRCPRLKTIRLDRAPDWQLRPWAVRVGARKRAEVTPRAKPLEKGKDPVAYIILTNITRRHLTKGQQAMTIAMIYPEPEQVHRGKKSEAAKLSGSGHLSRARVQEARVVLKHTPANAELVRDGTMSLAAAYKTAQSVKASTEGEEGVMRKLRAEAPDLADLVMEERMSLHEAAVALEERKRLEGVHRYSTWQLLVSGVSFAGAFVDGKFPDLSGYWDEFSGITHCKRLDAIAELEKLQKNLPALLTALRNQED